MTNNTVPIRFTWADADRVGMLFIFQPGWTWQDLLVLQSRANSMIDHEEHTVDIIYDLTEAQMRFKQDASYLKHIISTYPENIGMALWVGCSEPIESSIRSVTRTNKEMARLFAFLETRDEALAFIGP